MGYMSVVQVHVLPLPSLHIQDLKSLNIAVMAPPTPTPASTPTPNRSNRTMLETFHDETAPLNALKPGMQREIHAAEAQIRANRVLLAKIASAIERHKAAPSRQPRPKELETEDALLVDGTDTTMPETDFEAAMNSRNTPDDDAGLNALAFRSKEDQT